MTDNLHECNKCQKIFKLKIDYTRHIDRKISCVDDEKKIYIMKSRTCVYCNKTFSKPCVLVKHIENSCKIKKQNMKKKNYWKN